MPTAGSGSTVPSTSRAVITRTTPGIAAARIVSRRRSRACACGERSTRSEEHTSELQSQSNLVCRLLLEKKKKEQIDYLSCNQPDRHVVRQVHSISLHCVF